MELFCSKISVITQSLLQLQFFQLQVLKKKWLEYPVIDTYFQIHWIKDFDNDQPQSTDLLQADGLTGCSVLLKTAPRSSASLSS